MVDVKRDWDIRTDTPVVSASITTYNQKSYIKDCLDGVLMQETDFPFELIVHDDASTDGTAEIVREYAEKYPHIIIPILQKDNQRTLGRSSLLIALYRTRGKFVAICEGDDYWVDPNKLQRQFDAMNKNPECNLCFHPTHQVDGLSGEDMGLLGSIGSQPSVESLVDMVGRGLWKVATCSLMFRMSFFRGEQITSFFTKPRGSWIMKFTGAMSAGAVYLPDVMGAYRVNAINSYNERVKKDAEEDFRELVKLFNNIDNLDELTDRKFSDLLFQAKAFRIQGILRHPLLSKRLRQKIWRDYRPFLSRKNKVLLTPFFGFLVRAVIWVHSRKSVS